MNKRHTGSSRTVDKRGGAGGRGSRKSDLTRRYSTGKRPEPKVGWQILDREETVAETVITGPSPFRVIIAVHRPRYRGRTERAAALIGWEISSLLNKQDPVGQVAKAPGPPDILVLSGDFGRQKDLAIFRAVQPWREKGLKIIGLVEDCQTAPEGFPTSIPSKLCDICIPPPYTAAHLRELLTRIYREKRREEAPPPIKPPAGAVYEEELDE